MFKTKPNYFYKPAPANKYAPIQTSYEWQDVAPKTKISSELLEFVKPIKKYVAVQHNYQQDINTQIYYTPEQIEKFGIKLDPNETANIYQKVDTSKMNATDVRNETKKAVQEGINEMAIKQTNKQIEELQKQLNNLKNKNAATKQEQKKEGENNK